jgi:VIT1/CCC1 family predicted Fe2+/Mn2+ transporter
MPAPLPDLGPTLSKPHGSLRNKRGVVEAPDLTLERPAPAASAAHAHVLQVVQPGLLGLMDGSVSTLAPLFATAALTGRTESAFLVGLAASVGAGISMGLAEALSDDGQISGRGKPLMRGVITGGGTVVGGMLHTLPFLLTNLHTALLLAYAVVVFELLSIAYIRYRWMNSPLGKTVVQVIVGGGIVFGLGIWLGKIGAGG